MKERFESSSINEIAGGLTAPMPGKVVDVPVKKMSLLSLAKL